MLFNRCGWAEWVIVDNQRLMSLMQIKREKTFIDIRDKLVEAKLIEYVKGKKDSPNKYKLISFEVKNTFKNEVQTEVKSEVYTEVKSEVYTEDIKKDKDKDKDKKRDYVSMNEDTPEVSSEKKWQLY